MDEPDEDWSQQIIEQWERENELSSRILDEIEGWRRNALMLMKKASSGRRDDMEDLIFGLLDDLRAGLSDIDRYKHHAVGLPDHRVIRQRAGSKPGLRGERPSPNFRGQDFHMMATDELVSEAHRLAAHVRELDAEADRLEARAKADEEAAHAKHVESRLKVWLDEQRGHDPLLDRLAVEEATRRALDQARARYR